MKAHSLFHTQRTKGIDGCNKALICTESGRMGGKDQPINRAIQTDHANTKIPIAIASFRYGSIQSIHKPFLNTVLLETLDPTRGQIALQSAIGGQGHTIQPQGLFPAINKT